jgi:hypothetical protein
MSAKTAVSSHVSDADPEPIAYSTDSGICRTSRDLSDECRSSEDCAPEVRSPGHRALPGLDRTVARIVERGGQLAHALPEAVVPAQRR